MVIRTWFGVFAFVAVLTSAAVLATRISLQINYDDTFRAFVMWKAMTSAVFITIPLALFGALMVLKSTRLADELARVVSRDRLTDLSTRDHFFSRLEDTPETYGVSLMVDIDHFKRINDTHGHLSGDHVIAQVAHVLKAQTRSEDIVCRFGGEEFVIFLDAADEYEAEQVAERIRETTARLAPRSEAGVISVSVSLGGALKRRADDIEDAIRRADSCLYHAKETGRNRSVFEWSQPRAA